MSSIPLHPEKGVNPYLTYCRRCGKDAQELILVGSNDGIYECSVGHKMIGRPTPSTRHGDCPECGTRVSWSRVGTLEDHQRLPATDICDDCKKEVAEHKAFVEAGGVFVKCVDCGMNGVAKPETPFAKFIRERQQELEGEKIHDGWYTKPQHFENGKPVYALLGSEINKEMGCPECERIAEEQKQKEKSHDAGSAGTGSEVV